MVIRLFVFIHIPASNVNKRILFPICSLQLLSIGLRCRGRFSAWTSSPCADGKLTKPGSGWETCVETLCYLHFNPTIVYSIDMRVKTNNQGAEATKCRCAGGGRGRTRKWRRSRHEDGPASTQVATQGRTPFLPHMVTCCAGKWSTTPKAPSASNSPTALLLRPRRMKTYKLQSADLKNRSALQRPPDPRNSQLENRNSDEA